MDKDTSFCTKIIFALFFIVMGYMLFNLVMLFEPDEYDFCKKQGYDYMSWYNGKYKDYKNEDYGRIICSKYFVEGRETKVFNVTETKWGYALEGLSE